MHSTLLRAGAAVLVCALVISPAAHADHHEAKPPKGFVALFNGKDLSGWNGLIGNGDPKKNLLLKPNGSAPPRRRKPTPLCESTGVPKVVRIVNDGKGPYLCTDKDYGDFELLIDWKMTKGTDSGIYLRGTTTGADLGSSQRQSSKAKVGLRRSLQQSEGTEQAARRRRQAGRRMEHVPHQDGW